MTFNLTTLEPLEALEALEANAMQRDSPAQRSSALNILIVDDHPANCLLLRQQLEFLGHHCAVAGQGAEGLQLWLEGGFDLVVADCNMPVMNGYALTRAIRSHEQTETQQACVIWGFTANAQPEEKQRCREAGMDDCLFKPISLTSLSERLTRVHPLPTSRNVAPHTAQSESAGTFNMGSVSALTGDRPEMVQRLLVQLLQSSQEDRQELIALTPSVHRPELCQLAHKIKGAARIIRASDVIEHCEKREDACVGTTSDDAIATCQRAVEQAMIELEEELRGALERVV